MNDPAETLITQSLASRAAEAPSDTTLLGTVHRRLRRRRRTRAAGVGVLACAAVIVAAAGVQSLTRPEDSGPAASLAQPPPGWHWESYANVEVQVPDQWAEISAGPLATCPTEKPRWDGWIGRPSTLPAPAMGCPTAVGATAATVGEPADRVPYVLFDLNAEPGVTQYDAGWTKEVRSVGALRLEVFGTDAAVRARILDSARTIDGVDSRGCAPTHPAATNAAVRPTGEGLAAVGTAASIRICAYRTETLSQVPPLLASAELTGEQAREVGAALLNAPGSDGLAVTKSGKVATATSKCTTGDEEILVLHVHGDRGDQEVVVRLNGCGPFDTDDGRTFRSLTKSSVGPLVTAVGRPEDRGPFLTNLLK
ncbi:hypothetical protein BWI15_27155 [Kribbella sp. ALI-6-A]|uniref:hypothetical protein n=1 Tax=Kribbella sp. ALI-6-A TaxID=1933817 RepID=UPI00097BD675|nr:hypothetical protein [Kribbella sp. ALI-6-A]ONI66870.1 hypothetical protein BWI15_27155 [Kribbella sp. ALI-6-A]